MMKMNIRRITSVVLVLVTVLFFSGCTRILHLTLDTAGGIVACETEIDFEASNPPEIPLPEREGYIFAGWSGGDDWQKKGGTLVAEWKKIKYNVTFDLAGGECGSPELLSQNVEIGESAAEPAGVHRDDRIFEGWSEDFSCVICDIVVKALWGMEDLGEEKISELCRGKCLEIYAYDYSDIPVALGSGFLISSDGIFVTAAHVLKGCSAVEAVFYSGERKFATEVLYYNLELDVAVLKIDGEGYPFFEVSSELPDSGQKVYTIGSPDGRTGEMSSGQVIRLTDEYGGKTMIASNLHLEGGSSGSPMIDSLGRVIGINVAMSGATSESLTVPASILSDSYESSMTMGDFERISRAYAEECAEREPNDIPERAQSPESGVIVRASLSGDDDIDCYSIENMTSYKIIVSIPVKYYNSTEIKLYSPDGKYTAQTWNTLGHSGDYRLYYAILSADTPVSVFLEVCGEYGTPIELGYSVRIFNMQ